MAQRVIPCAVTNEYVSGDGVTIGTAGSINAVKIELDFRAAGPQWDGTTKRVLWTDPTGTAEITPVLLQDSDLAPGHTKIYLTEVPAAVLSTSGWCEMAVQGGTVDSSTDPATYTQKVRTEPSRFRVLPGKESAGYNDGIPASVGDQLQTEVGLKVNKPADPYDPNGNAGQILSTLGDGRTEWVDLSEEYVADALDHHPEWITRIGDGTITTEKLADYAVTGQKIANDSIDTGALLDGTVTTPKIWDGAVTREKLAAGVTGELDGIAEDIEGLGGRITDETEARQAADTLIQEQLASPFNFKGSVATLTALAAISSPTQNDTYYVESEYCRYSFTGDTTVGTSGWVQSSMDFEDYEEELDKIKASIGNEEIVFTSGGYIATNGGTTDYTVVESSSYKYAIVDCSGGDLFTVSGVGASSARLWAFVDSSGKILTKAASGLSASGLFLEAPVNAAKLVLNTQGTTEKSFTGWLPVSDAILTTKNQLGNILDLSVNRAKVYITGAFINKINGNEGSLETCVATDYISIGKKVLIWSYNPSNNNVGYSFYDADKNVIAGSSSDIYSISGVWTTLNTPDGAKFFRASCHIDYVDQFAVYANVTPDLVRLQKMSEDLGVSYEAIPVATSGYIKGDGNSTDYTVVSNGSYKCAVADCVANDLFYIDGTGAITARLWFFADQSGTILDRAEPGARGPVYVIAPKGSSKLVICNSNSSSTPIVSYKGIKNISGAIEALYDKGYAEETVAQASFFDNLKTQKREHGFLRCKQRTGVVSNDSYGADNTKYTFDYKQTSKVHVCFDFRFTKNIPLSSTATDINLFYDARTNLGIRLKGYDALVAHCKLRRRIYLSDGTTNNPITSSMYDSFFGEYAFYIQYTGEYDDVKLVVNADNLQIKRSNDTVLYTVSYDPSEPVEDLFTRLTNLADVSGEALEVVSHTCEELPLYAGLEIPMIYAETLYGEETQTNTKCRVYVPYSYDDKWHNFEIIIDQDNLNAVFSLDGLTWQKALDSSAFTDNYTMVCGGNKTANNEYIVLKDLKVDFDGFGDAELITNRVYPFVSPTVQLISARNPKVLIFEGHGIYVGKDSGLDIPDMATSTDRLRLLLGLLAEKGYENITVDDFLDWKLHNGSLPKRGYLIFFDDARIENYIDYNRRRPFIEYGAVANLALITGGLQNTYTANGTTYTKEQCLAMIQRNGWGIASHTRNHRHISATTVAGNWDEFKEDVLSADSIGVRSDVIVYPFGEGWALYSHILQDSGFKIGVRIAVNYYTCKMLDNYVLPRVDIRSSIPIETFLSQFDESPET